MLTKYLFGLWSWSVLCRHLSLSIGTAGLLSTTCTRYHIWPGPSRNLATCSYLAPARYGHQIWGWIWAYFDTSASPSICAWIQFFLQSWQYAPLYLITVMWIIPTDSEFLMTNKVFTLVCFYSSKTTVPALAGFAILNPTPAGFEKNQIRCNSTTK